MATEQIAVRIPEELLRRVDELVAAGVYESRAAAVRAGIEAVAAEQARQRVDRAILDGYQRVPPTAGDDAAAMASLRAAISEEPW